MAASLPACSARSPPAPAEESSAASNAEEEEDETPPPAAAVAAAVRPTCPVDAPPSSSTPPSSAVPLASLEAAALVADADADSTEWPWPALRGDDTSLLTAPATRPTNDPDAERPSSPGRFWFDPGGTLGGSNSVRNLSEQCLHATGRFS